MLQTIGGGVVNEGTMSLDIISVAPLLGPLADNGGPTWTHALLSASPAVDEGAGGPDCLPVDQRDMVRPQGVACDIGAYAHCWISTITVEVEGDLTGLPFVTSAPVPTPEPEGCYVYGPTKSELVCTVPCPEDARQRGVCVP